MTFSEKRNITYNTRISYGFETRNIEIVHIGSDKIVYLDPVVWDLVSQKTKGSENINIFKSNIRPWKLENCSCSFIVTTNWVSFKCHSCISYLFDGCST